MRTLVLPSNAVTRILKVIKEHIRTFVQTSCLASFYVKRLATCTKIGTLLSANNSIFDSKLRFGYTFATRFPSLVLRACVVIHVVTWFWLCCEGFAFSWLLPTFDSYVSNVATVSFGSFVPPACFLYANAVRKPCVFLLLHTASWMECYVGLPASVFALCLVTSVVNGNRRSVRTYPIVRLRSLLRLKVHSCVASALRNVVTFVDIFETLGCCNVVSFREKRVWMAGG